MRFFVRATFLAVLVSGPAVAASAATIETIVFVRHGEKPKEDLGQLTCQGLNRALKLHSVIEKSFPRPNAIFAPDPSKRKEGEAYDYVRPLATIEPTAIELGMPINAQIGFDDTEALRNELEKERYHNGLVLVAWEHHKIPDVARMLLSENGGDMAKVPDWADHDFDSIYVVTIDWTNNKANFEQKQEGLDGQSDICP